MCILKAVLCENRQPKANLKMWILLKRLNFRMDFFGTETSNVYVRNLQSKRMSLFEKNKNRSKVENLHCSLGLLQQTMMISTADHHDLSLVYQAQAYQTVGQQKSGPL